MAVAIETHGLAKQYQLGEGIYTYLTVRDALAARLRGGRDDRGAPTIWALEDVSLRIDEGEIVGIIGRNGAGKTTLLKILSRITAPTRGRARTRGRVGSLLEVGTGFHPELTGRENVFLNGAILGMPRREIARRFDEIVTFAGVERFLDTPLKRYSSGMYLRLAFAVAAHMEPAIIAVDEVLAVGDAEFQRKCLGRMSDLGREGRTVLFVSHDLGAVTRLCSRAVWLDRGRVVADAPSSAVVESYLESTRQASATARFPIRPDAPVQLLSASASNEHRPPEDGMRRYEPIVISFRLRVPRAIPGLGMAVYLVNRQGITVLDEAWVDHAPDASAASRAGLYTATLTVPPVLPAGDYAVRIWVGTEYEEYVDEEALRVHLLPHPADTSEAIERRRIVQPQVRWTLGRQDAERAGTDG
jgi:ABC-type polysaccharide/polyol phosphate transport system ATPase subunit